MKFRLLTILTIVGAAFVGCNSNSSTENLTDSAVVDTVLRADSVIVEATPISDTLLVDSI